MGRHQIQECQVRAPPHSPTHACMRTHASHSNMHGVPRTITAAHEWGVTGLQYDSPNGILASSALDGTIKLWNVETGKNVATLRGHTRGVYCCACRDNLVVSGSVDETVRLWDKRDGSCIAVLKGHSDDVTSVQLDAQADNVVSGSGDATIRYAPPSSVVCRTVCAFLF